MIGRRVNGQSSMLVADWMTSSGSSARQESSALSADWYLDLVVELEFGIIVTGDHDFRG